MDIEIYLEKVRDSEEHSNLQVHRVLYSSD